MPKEFKQRRGQEDGKAKKDYNLLDSISILLVGKIVESSLIGEFNYSLRGFSIYLQFDEHLAT
jgi:hypothetical protein